MPKYTSYQEFISGYQQEKITCADIVQYYLDKIEKTKDFNIYTKTAGQCLKSDYKNRSFYLYKISVLLKG